MVKWFQSLLMFAYCSTNLSFMSFPRGERGGKGRRKLVVQF